MFHSRPTGRAFALGFSVMLVLAAALPLGVLAKDGAAQAAAASLGPDDERLLSEAISAGRSEVTVLVAAKGGAARQAAQAITNAGGRIAYRDDALGYFRAIVPLGAVRGLAANAAIHGLDLDDVVALPQPLPDAAQPLLPQPVPDASTDRDNPYMPIGDTGAAAFIEAHPDWDGRGVKIGIVDTRRLARSSEPDHDEHRRPQGRRVGDRHRSVHRQRSDLDQHGHPGLRRDASPSTRVPTRRRPRARTASASSTRSTRHSAASSVAAAAATSTATATRPDNYGRPVEHARRTRSGSTPMPTTRSPTRPA